MSFGESAVTKFTPNNPYDSFMFYRGCLFPIELKSTKGTSVSIQFTKKEKGKMIKLNQIKGLEYASTFPQIYSGFVLDFRTSDVTYYLDVKDFRRFLNESKKKSINEKDILEYDGIVLTKVMKVKYYKYKVKSLLKKIIERGELNE